MGGAHSRLHNARDVFGSEHSDESSRLACIEATTYRLERL